MRRHCYNISAASDGIDRLIDGRRSPSSCGSLDSTRGLSEAIRSALRSSPAGDLQRPVLLLFRMPDDESLLPVLENWHGQMTKNTTRNAIADALNQAGAAGQLQCASLDDPTAGTEAIQEFVHRRDAPIGDGIIKECPEPFGRLQLRGKGRQKRQMQPYRQYDLGTAVPARLIH